MWMGSVLLTTAHYMLIKLDYLGLELMKAQKSKIKVFSLALAFFFCTVIKVGHIKLVFTTTLSVAI